MTNQIKKNIVVHIIKRMDCEGSGKKIENRKQGIDHRIYTMENTR